MALDCIWKAGGGDCTKGCERCERRAELEGLADVEVEAPSASGEAPLQARHAAVVRGGHDRGVGAKAAEVARARQHVATHRWLQMAIKTYSDTDIVVDKFSTQKSSRTKANEVLYK